MVKKTTQENVIIRHIHIWPIFSEPRNVYALKLVLYIFINVLDFF